MAKGRQPPKAPPKKTTQGYRTPEEPYRAANEAAAIASREMGSEALARNQAVIKEVNAGIARSQARSRAVQKEADEAVARANKLMEEYEARAREITQRTRQRDLYITTALAAGLGGLAIYEAGRTIHNIRRGRAVAQAQALAQAQVQAQQRADNRRGRASSNLEVIPHGALPAVATQETQEL